ncbi:MAG: xanthine dehydrogenase family protein molybdopterin-binding subunit [Proteobacteria bacterium]|nr:xanthine dehydrogenase family protein molybdopterin-binding subunit [Pseudomonadota bacterium]
MNEISPTPPAFQKFASGQSVSRKEDPRLLRGEGRYTDDIDLPGMAYGYVLRSPHAHGVVRGIDVSAAREVAGVVAAYTIDDLKAAGYGPFPGSKLLKNIDGSDPQSPVRYALADRKVNFAGEGLAFVVAETPAAARDGAEAVMFDIDPLPAIVDPEEALAPGAVQIHDDAANLCVDWREGDFDAVEAAFAKAAHVTRMRIPINRVVVATMEPRGAVGEYDAASERFTIHLGCQGVHGMRQTLATAVLKIEPEKLHVISKDIGGSFGMKSQQFGENLLVLHAARDLGRPVKWIDDRSGAFLSDYQGRDMIADGALALNEEGDFLAMRIDMIGNLGAYMTPFGPVMPSGNIMKNAASLYKTPAIAVTCRCALTNTVAIAPYRGAGRPEGNYIMERLVDGAARETGHDKLELRRRNLIPAEAIPFKAASGMEYDSGDFPAILTEAVARADWDGYAARREASEARGMLRGHAVTSYLEVTAGPGKELGAIRFNPNGHVTILTGSLDQGQGHATAFAQIVCERLGVPFEAIDLVQGDSDQLKMGGGTGGSKSAMASGNAFALASDAVIENGRQWAAHEMETAVEDIEFTAGEFRVAGTDRAISIQDLAARVASAGGTPDGLPDSLDAELVTDTPPSAFPNGCHICEVEIDPETGHCRIDRYMAVNDFGNLINPMLVEGQTHGGIVQGIGQALMETAIYDDDGQLLTGSFMDYAMPRAGTVPSFDIGHHPVPATSNALGIKGCGEAGTSGAIPTAFNAILDALSPLGVTDLPMPATPQRIWRAIQKGRE